MLFDHLVLAALAISFSIGVLLQILGCALWHNWWPLLTAFMYVLVPMPYLFFGASSSGSSSLYGDSSLASGWIDAGKFLTGFSAVGSIAIPAILFHAEKITGGALATELAAVAVLASTAFAFDYLNNEDGSYY
ncbi:g2498 [Coccomyxa elongata]